MVGVIVIANVVGGGMRSVTFVQAFQYWLKLTAVAIPGLVLSVYFLADSHELGALAPPTVDEQTTVDITTDVVVQVSAPVTVGGRERSTEWRTRKMSRSHPVNTISARARR